MRPTFRSLAGLSIGIGLIFTANMQARADGRGSTSAAFLKLPTGARAIGMGESYVAVGDDVQALNWNPAGIGRLEGREFTFMHAEWFQGIRYESLSYAQPLGGFVFLGGGVDFLNSGTIDKTTFKDLAAISGGPESYPFDLNGTFSVSNVVITAGGAVDASGLRWLPISNVQIGMNARALYQKIDTASDLAPIVDLGALWSPERLAGWTFGIVGQNMGPAIGDAKAKRIPPITFRTGAAYKPSSKVYTVACDILVPVDAAPRFSVGGEYWYRKIICFRGGYKLQGKIDYNEYQSGGLEGISAGAGFKYQIVQVDYAFATLGFLGATHRVSLTVNF